MNAKGAALRIARCALMAAMLTGVKAALSAIPNFEMVTLLIIIFTRHYGKDVFWSVAVFNLCELVIWGYGFWWVSYLYVWNLLVILVLLLGDKVGDDGVIWAAFSAMFGLFFGALFAAAYIPISPSTAWAYFLSGLPWDIWHGICNFALMLALYKPLNSAMERIKKSVNK